MNYDGLGLALHESVEQSVPICLLDVSIIHSCLEEEEEEELTSTAGCSLEWRVLTRAVSVSVCGRLSPG